MRQYTYTTCNTITVEDIYGKDITDVPSYKIIDFRPVQKGDSYLAVAEGYHVLKSNFDRKEQKSEPRLILHKKENELDLREIKLTLCFGKKTIQLLASEVYGRDKVIIPDNYVFNRFDVPREGEKYADLWTADLFTADSFFREPRIIVKPRN